MPLGLFPAGGTKIGSGPFSIISHAFLRANKITADAACIRTATRSSKPWPRRLHYFRGQPQSSHGHFASVFVEKTW